MALAELIGKLKSKKQAVHRSALGHHLEAVKALALGKEIDADEVEIILAAAGKSENDLEADVAVMDKRIAAAAELAINEASREGYEVACRKVVDAQEKLDEAYRRFQPAVEAAVNERAALELKILQTQNGESFLLTSVLNVELLSREDDLISERREIQQKLRPLQEDRKKLFDWSRGEHYRNIDLQKKLEESSHSGTMRRHALEAVTRSDSEIDDLASRMRQIDAATLPMQKRLDAIAGELETIHQEKLKP
jgi:hypothetical protein